MQAACWDTLILSDLHLGSEISRAGEALDLLQSSRFRRLILLGDIFCDLNFRRLTKDHWHFLSYIRKLSNLKRKVEVVWVEGNHDHGLAEVMSHLVGIPVYKQYVWDYAGKRHLAIHGHQFDRFVVNNYLLSHLGELAYLHLQRWDFSQKRLVRWLDRLNTSWLRLTEKVADGALNYAKQGQADRVFCGHTHVALQRHRDGIEYFNSGSWVDMSCNYITVDEEGVNIREYTGSGTQHRHSSQERTSATSGPSRLPLPAGLPGIAAYESVRC